MENFNPKEYRDNLAKDLKDTRKTDTEKAQEVLSEAQETEGYQEAKKIHQENRKEMREKEFEKEFGITIVDLKKEGGLNKIDPEKWLTLLKSGYINKLGGY